MLCKVCGKELTGRQRNYCSRRCSKLGGKRRKKGLPENIRPKRSHLEWTDQDIQNRINTKSSKMIYVGGYESCEKPIYIYCDDCGQPFKWSAERLRRTNAIKCDNCQQIISNVKEKEHKICIQENKIIRHEEIIKKRMMSKHRYCKQCGKEFYSDKQHYSYCSEKCRNKLANTQRSIKRRIKIKSVLVDNDISVDKLIKRDGSKCWICGAKVNVNDYEVRENGCVVAGPTYPSVDHVVALSNGGLHSWNNVRLAHRECNTKKSNKMFYWGEDNQLRMFC